MQIRDIWFGGDIEMVALKFYGEIVQEIAGSLEGLSWAKNQWKMVHTTGSPGV
jgi:hypothetical protein